MDLGHGGGCPSKSKLGLLGPSVVIVTEDVWRSGSSI